LSNTNEPGNEVPGHIFHAKKHAPLLLQPDFNHAIRTAHPVDTGIGRAFKHSDGFDGMHRNNILGCSKASFKGGSVYDKKWFCARINRIVTMQPG
jgi:hypothetical protein